MKHLARILMVLAGSCHAAGAAEGDPQRGYQLLTSKAYLPYDFDQETFDLVWQVWPESLRDQAATATNQQRRRLAFARYGLTGRPADETGKPLQYVVDSQGHWTMNCFACHAGQLLGQAIPGLPNANFALETLTADIRKTKLQVGKRLTRMDVGSLAMPLGRTRGTTNAVMFGVALMAYRDTDLNLRPYPAAPKMVHHDMDAPPWWHFHKKQHIYIDGFAPKSVRALMQFMLVRENGPEKFPEWEDDFGHVYAYLQSLRPPENPFPIDRTLARRGQQVFQRACAQCHGTYGREWTYPGRVVPIQEVGTDRVRLDALQPANRQGYARSWFAHHGHDPVIDNPAGYVAPPLDGIWASAPYFHNGSVPTLWHVLHPDQRPIVWKRASQKAEQDTRQKAEQQAGQEYDQDRVGLAIEEFSQLPRGIATSAQLREYFDTRRFGKSAAGHTFPDQLDADEKRLVLEYLKTL